MKLSEAETASRVQTNCKALIESARVSNTEARKPPPLSPCVRPVAGVLRRLLHCLFHHCGLHRRFLSSNFCRLRLSYYNTDR
ncbi:hypothetical protein L6452_17134 [Arctium lappa]|uniref:Uncharacterized protein n=1 Tax=Arctium lappa TaxID=4217 RepID=A0ACB9C2J4_ARCLA|nr:hypothetical protein L6452_17134 [Arctium lappa]